MAAERTNPGKGKRVLPRISAATSGLLPGIDLADLPALEEIDDRKIVERMGLRPDHA
jgi:hypothetical protein